MLFNIVLKSWVRRFQQYMRGEGISWTSEVFSRQNCRRAATKLESSSSFCMITLTLLHDLSDDYYMTTIYIFTQPTELYQYSDKIDLSYDSLVNVGHRKDDSAPNTVMEIHPTMLSFSERDLITAERCNIFMERLETNSYFDNLTVLCVGHGASLKYCTR